MHSKVMKQVFTLSSLWMKMGRFQVGLQQSTFHFRHTHKAIVTHPFHLSLNNLTRILPTHHSQVEIQNAKKIQINSLTLFQKSSPT